MNKLRESDFTYKININNDSTSQSAGGFNTISREININSAVINSGKIPKLPDTEGGSFLPSVKRVLSHELGHAFVLENSNRRFLKTPAGGRATTEIENIISKEINPEAPTRDGGFDGHKSVPK